MAHTSSRRRMPGRALAVATLAVAVFAGAAVVYAHFALVKSQPAKDAVVEKSPETLQLWFSQVPAAGVSRVQLKRGDEEIEIGRTTISADDKSMSALVETPLSPGVYTIVWRGAGDDGHVLNGELSFTLKPASVPR